MRRLFHAIVVAGCALPAACARVDEEPPAPADAAADDAFTLPDTDTIEWDVSTMPDTAMQDAADTPHPHITK